MTDNAQPTPIDTYINAFPRDVQTVLKETRRRVRRAVPADAEETISYQIPTIKVDGRSVVHFAGWKHHVSLYPIPATDETTEREIAPYRAGKGTLKFPLGEPIPYDLIERLTALLVTQRAARRT